MPRRKQYKIQDSSADEQKRKRRVMIFGVIMIALMILSVAGVVNYAPGSYDYTYGDYEFVLEDRPGGGSALVAEINGQPVEFQNLPVQVLHLEVDPEVVPLLDISQQVALVADPTMPVEDASLVDYARLQLSLALGKTINAISQEDERYAVPVLNCTHASWQMPVIMFEITNETAAITKDGECVTIRGEGQDLMRLKDRLIFDYYGITDEVQVGGE